MKKTTALLLALCLMAGLLPAAALAAENGACGTTATYTLSDDGTLTISGTGSIKANAFRYYENKADIKNIVIEEGITLIGNYAFMNCTNLQTVTIPSTVTTTGGGVFYGCSKATALNYWGKKDPSTSYNDTLDGVDFAEINVHADYEDASFCRTTNIRKVLGSASPVTHFVDFDATGGNCATAETETNTEGKLTALPTAAKQGCTFNGWFTAAVGGSPITTDTVFTERTTVYAHWTAIAEHVIERSGSADTENTYTIDIRSLMPPDAKLSSSQLFSVTNSDTSVISNVNVTCSETISQTGSITCKTRALHAAASGTFVVTFFTENYGNIRIVVNVTLTGKQAVTIFAEAEDALYDGTAHAGMKNVSGTLPGGAAYPGTFTYAYATEDGTTLTAAPTEPGIYDVTIKPTDTETYTGEKTVRFLIKKALTDDMATLSFAETTYNGNAQKPDILVKDGDNALIENLDYTVVWDKAEFVDAGIYTAVVTGKGKYSGTITKSFVIKAEEGSVPVPLIPQVSVPVNRLPEYIEAEEVTEEPEEVLGDIPDVEEGTADTELI